MLNLDKSFGKVSYGYYEYSVPISSYIKNILCFPRFQVAFSLIELSTGKGGRGHPYKASLKVLSIFSIRNHIKTLPSSLFLEDREAPDRAGDGDRVEITSIQSFNEGFIKIQLQEPCQDSPCPPSLFKETWRTGRFLIDLEMESGWRGHPYKASLKVSSRSNIRNLVKTLPVHQVSSWSLGGQVGSW